VGDGTVPSPAPAARLPGLAGSVPLLRPAARGRPRPGDARQEDGTHCRCPGPVRHRAAGSPRTTPVGTGGGRCRDEAWSGAAGERFVGGCESAARGDSAEHAWAPSCGGPCPSGSPIADMRSTLYALRNIITMIVIHGLRAPPGVGLSRVAPRTGQDAHASRYARSWLIPAAERKPTHRPTGRSSTSRGGARCFMKCSQAPLWIMRNGQEVTGPSRAGSGTGYRIVPVLSLDALCATQLTATGIAAGSFK
jgi:hypothetical protein